MNELKPKLRFKGFNEKINSVELNQISLRISDGIHSTPIYDLEGDYFFINGNNLINGKIVITKDTKRVSKAETLKHVREIDSNTLLISINGTIGNTAIYNGEKIILGKSACYIKLKTNADKIYILNYLESKRIQKYFQSELTGSTIKNLSLKSIGNANVFVPDLSEQQKIASFLSSIDSYIENLKQQKEALEKYKKGMMQKIFSQEIGFKDENGKEFPGWEEKRLGSICRIRTGKLDANAMVEDGKFRFYTCAKDFYFIDKYAFDTEALLISGNGANVGYIHYYKGKFNAYQRTYVLDGFEMNIQYIKFFLDEFLSTRIFNEKKAGNTPYIVMSTLSEMKVLCPSIGEQEKIANYLSQQAESINSKIQQIEKAEQWKKGLLQQLFI